MTIKKITVDASSEFREGVILGMDNMLAMVMTVFEEHPEMTKEQIKQYIKDNL
jgi:hypothetical protein